MKLELKSDFERHVLPHPYRLAMARLLWAFGGYQINLERCKVFLCLIHYLTLLPYLLLAKFNIDIQKYLVAIEL